MTNIQKSRVKILKEMHNYIIDLGDEDAYDWWITGAIPDEPSDEDFETVATDDRLWMSAIRYFYYAIV